MPEENLQRRLWSIRKNWRGKSMQISLASSAGKGAEPKLDF
jgi:hypothetical protein